LPKSESWDISGARNVVYYVARKIFKYISRNMFRRPRVLPVFPLPLPSIPLLKAPHLLFVRCDQVPDLVKGRCLRCLAEQHFALSARGLHQTRDVSGAMEDHPTEIGDHEASGKQSRKGNDNIGGN
jgi:hypothetical protein